MLKVKLSSLPLRGYHDYKKRLEDPVKLGEQLELLIETKRFGGTCTFPVAAVRNKDGNSETVGHIPKEFSWCFKVVIRAGGWIMAIVTNEKPERRKWKYGEEIICEYIFHGPNKPEIRNALRSLKKVLKEPFWTFYRPQMVYCIQEDNKEECVEWSLKEESGNRESEDIQDDMPEELENDPFTKQLYEKAIKYGQEIDRSIRVMVIGCFGQGKTSLVKRLFKEPIDDIIDSTNGINVNQFEVKENNWKRKDTDEIDAGKRLVSVSRSTPSFEMEQSESDDVGNSGDFVQETDGATDVFKNGIGQKRKEPESVAQNVCVDSQENMKKMKVEGATSQDVKKETKKAGGEPSSQSVNGTQKQMCKSDSDMLKEFSSVMKKTSETDIADTSLAGTIWDFGGQFIFYSTHQLFHSRQAIYLLVFDLSKGLDETIKDADFPNRENEKTLKDYIKFWVNSVHSFVGSENGEEPHIILVGTHKDTVEPDQDVDECFDNVRKLFEDSKLFNHIYYKHFAISNVEPDSKEVDRLRNVITELGKDLSEKKSPIPAKWIPLEKSLKEKQHPDITSFENILRINKENEFPIKEEDEIKLFLHFHHSRGGLFYFDDTELSKHVILNPQYLIDAFRCIVTSRKFCNVKQNLRAMWKNLCENAILQPDLIEKVWGKNSESYFLEHKEVLLAFLQRHRIISEVQRYSEEENNSSSPEPLGYYIVPSFLKTKSSDKLISSFMEGKERTQVSLVYMFEYEGVVQTIYHKVTAAGIGKWPLIKFRDQSLLYENLSVFELKHDHAGMIFFNGNKLELLVINLSPPDNVSEAISDLFRCFFEAIVDWEFRKLRVGDKGACARKLYTNLVRCFDLSHGNSGSKNMHAVDKNHYRGVHKIPCPDYESHCLKVEDAMKEWYFDDIDTETIPNRTLSTKEYSKLATAIGEGWELLGYKLGLGVVKIDQIKMDEDTTVNRIIRMFSVWQQEYQDKATLDVLVTAIRSIPSKVLHINWDILKNIIYGYG